MENQVLNVLSVTASARQTDSVTRRFASEMLDELHKQHARVKVVERNVSAGLPFVDETWVSANFTPAEQRNDAQKAVLAGSDALVAELSQADVLLIAAPIYNFSVPATLKAWIDQIARVGLTFNYTSNGPVGALQGKKAYLLFASGGTELDSEIDFASGYLRHIMGFIGINDVSFISAACFDETNEQATQEIRQQITELARQAA
ncbi:FMN-dependent NADH-azoreductase [hydrothermal vent metagenome]|uniref:FMN-dependent NADH-azoreductase n=1 Tax=hydrothermal vent metagenome TaxID=652676 RepID=A0A3B0ZG88_9ZZZZ